MEHAQKKDISRSHRRCQSALPPDHDCLRLSSCLGHSTFFSLFGLPRFFILFFLPLTWRPSSLPLRPVPMPIDSSAPVRHGNTSHNSRSGVQGQTPAANVHGLLCRRLTYSHHPRHLNAPKLHLAAAKLYCGLPDCTPKARLFVGMSDPSRLSNKKKKKKNLQPVRKERCDVGTNARNPRQIRHNVSTVGTFNPQKVVSHAAQCTLSSHSSPRPCQALLHLHLHPIPACGLPPPHTQRRRPLSQLHRKNRRTSTWASLARWNRQSWIPRSMERPPPSPSPAGHLADASCT